MKYFRLLYRLGHQQRYLIWISNERDGVVVDGAGLVPLFKDAEAVQAYADQNSYNLESEQPVLHNLDWVAGWVGEPGRSINCSEALAAWNLFSDVADSFKGKEASLDGWIRGFRRSITSCSGGATCQQTATTILTGCRKNAGRLPRC